jgi:hypothetical protein
VELQSPRRRRKSLFLQQFLVKKLNQPLVELVVQFLVVVLNQFQVELMVPFLVVHSLQQHFQRFR